MPIVTFVCCKISNITTQSSWNETQFGTYHQISNISHTKSQNLNVSCLILQLSFLNPLKQGVNTLRPRKNCRHFPDDIFKWIFLNENVLISINISLKFVPKGPITNIQTLVQVMAWRRPGDKPLSEPMMVRLPTHICVTRPQWVKVRMM